MKKSIKIKSIEAFKEFAKKNSFGVFNDAFMSIRYTIRKPKPNEKGGEFYLQDMIEAGPDKISNMNQFFQFIKYCLHNNYSDVALAQIIKKNPRSSSYEYSTYVSDALSVLKPYKKTLFEYVARTTFLENSWHRLDTIFEVIDDQERKTAIFESMINTKTFQTVDTQKSIYQLLNNHIKVKENLLKHFTKISKVDENENVFEAIKENAALTFEYNPEKIANANLSGELTALMLVNNIKSYASIIKRMDELGIQTILIEEENKKYPHKMHIICEKSMAQVNKRIFDDLFNIVARFKTREQSEDFNKNIGLFVKEKQAEVLREKLQSTLSDGIIKKTKVKI
jgi:hypothetical protein